MERTSLELLELYRKIIVETDDEISAPIIAVTRDEIIADDGYRFNYIYDDKDVFPKAGSYIARHRKDPKWGSHWWQDINWYDPPFSFLGSAFDLIIFIIAFVAGILVVKIQ